MTLGQLSGLAGLCLLLAVELIAVANGQWLIATLAFGVILTAQ